MEVAMIVTSLIARALRAIRRNLENNRAARQLRTMSDAQLADIGIARDQIDLVVHGKDPTRARGRAPKAGFEWPRLARRLSA